MGIKNNLLRRDVGGVFVPLVLLIFFAVSICMLSAEDLSKVGKQTTEKIGFADFPTVYNDYSPTKAEDERLKEKDSELQAKIDVENDKITELEKKMNSGILSKEEKNKLNAQIEDAKAQVSKMRQVKKLEMDSYAREAMRSLAAELVEKISNYGKEKGYSMIINKSALIFSDTSLDLTQEIVDYINKDAPVRTDIKKEAGGSK
ncbi:MAG: OmpH family outer membrane protein [Candidatus Zixiibacteriota bacterium]